MDVLLFLITSFVLFMGALADVVIRLRKQQANSGSWVRFLLLLFASVWCMRFVVGLYAMKGGLGPAFAGMGYAETVLDSAVHALQTFSMDEDYTLYLKAAKRIAAELSSSGFVTAFAGYFCSVQNITAPVAGGALLLDLLSNVFPKFRLLLQSARDKYVFSELNEKAVYLAESIVFDGIETSFHENSSGTARKAIIFTDVYVGADSEARMELLHRVRKLGGVALQDDISMLKLRGRRRLFYILADQDDGANLNTAIELAERCDCLCGKASEINVLFVSQDDYSANIIRDLFRTVGEDGEDCESGRPRVASLRGKREKIFQRIITKVIRDDTSVIYNFLDRYPLYLPLLQSKREPEAISVMTVGSGKFVLELMKAVYWCGQVFDADSGGIKPLQIHALGGPNLQEDLALAMPSVDLGGNDAYCAFSFYRYQNTTDLLGLMAAHEQLLDCNYIVVALENDRSSIDVAHWLRREYDQRNLGNGRVTLIYYLVADSRLCDTLNRSVAERGRTDFVAFGSLKSRYNTYNIFAPDLEEKAYCANSQHDRNTRENFLRDEYSRRSSIATVVHAKYKLFSADKSAFEKATGELAVTPEEIAGLIDRHKHILAWLEHRRWNAYVISCGFRRPTDEELRAYFMASSCSISAKQEELKLHGCIMGSRPTKKPIRYADWELAHSEDYDELDNFSLLFNQLMREKFSAEWRTVCGMAGQVQEILRRYIDEAGVLTDAGRCREELEQMGLSSAAIRLVIPTDFKQYDYDMVKKTPSFILKRRYGVGPSTQ